MPTKCLITNFQRNQSNFNLPRSLINNHMSRPSSLRSKPKPVKKQESETRTLTTLVLSWARSASTTMSHFSPSFILSWALNRSSTWPHSQKSTEALLRLLLNTPRDQMLLRKCSLRSNQEKTPKTLRASPTTSLSLKLMRSKRFTGGWAATMRWASLRLQTAFEIKSR